MSSSIRVGNNEYRGKITPIYYQKSDRSRHMYVIGKTGVGKSTVFQNMCLQDIKNGDGVCFIDPHGESVNWLLERIPSGRLADVVIFDPSDTEFPLGLNLLEARTDREKDFLVSECIEIFYKLFDPERTGVIGPQFEHWLRNAALTVMAGPDGGSIVEIPKLFIDKQFELEKRKHLKDPLVSDFWAKQMAHTSEFHRSEMLNYFMSKFGHFLNNELMRNIIGQHHSGFNLEDIIESKKILLVNLSKGKIGEINAHMLGLILISKLQVAILNRTYKDPSSRHPFYLYVDEFQNFVTDTFISILSESRKYGLGAHLTNQYLAQLPKRIQEAILGNVGTLLAFEVSANDAEILSKEFEPLEVQDFVSLERFNFYIKLMIDGKTSNAFSGISLPAESRSASPSIKQISVTLNRLAYALPKVLVENTLKRQLK